MVGRLIWDEDIVQVRVLSTLLFQDMGESGRPYLPWTQGIAGSNPAILTQCLRSSVGLEHLTFNEGVTGSSPVGDTIWSVGRVA